MNENKNKNKNKNLKNDVAGSDWCQTWPPIEPVHKTSKPQKNEKKPKIRRRSKKSVG
jgi:hypothetical protein